MVKKIKGSTKRKLKSKSVRKPISCWPGYKRVSGKKPGSKGSCKKI